MSSAAARAFLTSHTTLRDACVRTRSRVSHRTRVGTEPSSISPNPKRSSTIAMASSASAVPHRVGDTFRVKGLRLTDHFFDVPLDHGFRPPGVGDVPADDSRTIEIFAREVVAADKRDDDSIASMPWLVFLQGGPGFECARLTETGGWIAHAVASHRVLLLDQRGTGRSSRVSASALAKIDGGVDARASYLTFFRADSIVADAECVRKTLLGPGDDAKGRSSVSPSAGSASLDTSASPRNPSPRLSSPAAYPRWCTRRTPRRRRTAR